jgi:hypothetical protein
MFTFNLDDVAHILSRHTWENFPISTTWAKDANTMFPEGTTAAAIEAIGDQILRHADFEALVRAGASSGTVMGYGVQITHGIRGLVSFFPTAGETLSKDAMRGILNLFKSM